MHLRVFPGCRAFTTRTFRPQRPSPGRTFAFPSASSHLQRSAGRSGGSSPRSAPDEKGREAEQIFQQNSWDVSGSQPGSHSSCTRTFGKAPRTSQNGGEECRHDSRASTDKASTPPRGVRLSESRWPAGLGFECDAALVKEGMCVISCAVPSETHAAQVVQDFLR